MASQCDGLIGSAGEMAESEEMREMHTRLDVTKGECDDLQYQLRQVQEECKNLQWLLEHDLGMEALTITLLQQHHPVAKTSMRASITTEATKRRSIVTIKSNGAGFVVSQSCTQLQSPP